MRRAWKVAASAALLVAALAACSGGSDGVSDESSPKVRPTVVSSATVLVASSMTISSTSATSTPAGTATTPTTQMTTTPTTRTTTTTTTTTVATSTTAASPEAQVKADYLQQYDEYWACLRAPSTCDPSSLTASIGSARAALTKTVADLISGELFAGMEDPGYAVVESISFSDSRTALVTSCWWDTGVLYGPPRQPGGPHLVINNLQVTSRFETTVTLEAGRWLTSEERRVSRLEGENQCPPKS